MNRIADMPRAAAPPGDLPLALTLGEPAGIGPDLTLDLWRRRGELGLPPFYVIGDIGFLSRLTGRAGWHRNHSRARQT
jgi:4-hydroxythreonine-4-phosphate dehydrogenase